MRYWLILGGISAAVIVTVWVQVGLLGVWPMMASGINLVIIAILLIALFRSWTTAAWLAMLAGVLLGQYSVWPIAYPVALLGMLLGTWLILQRWLATRSSASLLAAAAVATLLFYGLLALTGLVLHTTDATAIGPDWGSTARLMLIQSFVHALVIYLFWRRLRGGSYARTTIGQSF